MGRNPTGSDVKMLKAGAALAKAKGLNGFTVRQVCAKSKVNLGMFHYYFSTKENFDMAVLESIYSKMIENIKIKVSPSASPKQNVRAILINIQEFIKENRVLLSSLGGDVFSGNKKTFKFIVKNFTKHVEILFGELLRAQKCGALAAPSALDAFLIIMPPAAVPQILLGLVSRLNVSLPGKLKASALTVMVEENAPARIDLLVNSIFKEK
ncbi:MAG: TetR/AcrR family transcriptional regulator [Elusimicrobiaceae bacterium]